jgi:hypothetical protein
MNALQRKKATLCAYDIFGIALSKIKYIAQNTYNKPNDPVKTDRTSR